MLLRFTYTSGFENEYRALTYGFSSDSRQKGEAFIVEAADEDRDRLFSARVQRLRKNGPNFHRGFYSNGQHFNVKSFALEGSNGACGRFE